MLRKAAWLALGLAGFTAGGGAAAEASPLRLIILPEKSQVEFISGTQLGEFRGITRQISGEVVLDPQEATRLRLAVSVDLRTLKSDNALRDQHMHDKVLEVGRFPSASFAASEFRPVAGAGRDGGEGVIAGALRLHGVERAVSIPVRYTLNGTTLRGEGNLLVKLTDFDMTPPRLLGLKVRDQVTVEIRFVASGG